MPRDARIGRPLHYFGSKENMAETIHGLIPADCETWLDLFCGSGIVTLKKARHRHEHINDLDGRIINLFEVLRCPERRSRLVDLVYFTPYAEAELKRAQALNTVADDPVEDAHQLLIRFWMSRGGDHHKTGFRHSLGQHSGPQVIWAGLPDRLMAVADRLRGITIWSRPSLALLDKFDKPGIVVFCDPPYPKVSRYRVNMRTADHEAFAARLRECRCRIILTMIPGTIYDQALDDWWRHEVTVQTDARDARPETIYCNFEPPRRRAQQEALL